MALSGALARGGNPPDRLEVSAVVTFSTDGGAHIEKSHLTVRGTVPGMDAAAFAEAADGAKSGCPVSKAIAGNVDITLDASLA
jgi:lipoyl-dependent peroxiredoxin